MFLKGSEKKELILKEFTSLFERNKGLCLLHNHNDLAFWENLISVIKSLPSLKHIYFEFTDGKEIYDKVPIAKNTPILEMIRNFSLHPERQTDEDSAQELQTYMLGKLLDTISETNIVMFFVDDPQRNNKSNSERNNYMFECISHLQKELNPNEKYIFITGAAHFDLANRLKAPILIVGSSIIDKNTTNPDFIKVSHKDSVSSNSMQSVSFIADTIINTGISPFQPENIQRDFFIYPSDWNLSKELLQKIAHLQKITSLGISVEIGRSIKYNKKTSGASYANKAPSIRMIISRNNLTEEQFNEIYRYLKRKSKGATHFAFWDTKEASCASIKLKNDKVIFTFFNNRSFVSAVDFLDKSLFSIQNELILKK